jgi:hypothetical protein
MTRSPKKGSVVARLLGRKPEEPALTGSGGIPVTDAPPWAIYENKGH